MSIRFYYDNLVDQSNLSASSVNAQFPVSNIKDPRRSKVFKSINNSVEVVFDLLDFREIDTIALVESSIEAFGFDSITVEINNVNAWTSPLFSQILSIDNDNGWININLPDVIVARYVRLVLSNTGGSVSLSKVFIGKSFYNSEICFTYPIDYKQSNNAIVSVNRYGQKFFDEITTIKEFSATIPSLNKAEMEEIITMLDFVSFTRPIWVNFNAVNVMEDPNRFNGYYYLKDDPSMTLDVGNYWSIDFNFQEGM